MGKSMKEKDRVVKNYEFVFRCRFVVLILFYHTLFFREQTVSTFFPGQVTKCQNGSDMENWKTRPSYFKTHAFREKISENTCFENRVCTESGRRTSDLKFIKNSCGVVAPPVVYNISLLFSFRFIVS